MSLGGPDRHLHDGSERATYPDGGIDETTEALDVLADALMPGGYVRRCRECGAEFNTRVPSAGSKWTDCCGPCLRALGCV